MNCGLYALPKDYEWNIQIVGFSENQHPHQIKIITENYFPSTIGSWDKDFQKFEYFWNENSTFYMCVLTVRVIQNFLKTYRCDI